MGATHYLVDCEGETLRSPFTSLRRASVNDLPDHVLTAYAVKVLGYAHVQEWPRGLVIFYCRPVTNIVVLAGLIYLLADLPNKRAIFSVADARVRYSLCGGRAQAIDKVVQEIRDLGASVWRTDRTVADANLSGGGQLSFRGLGIRS